MRLAYFDCFSGAAGDMILGALIHAGCPLDELQALLERLSIAGVRLEANETKRGGLAGVLARVVIEPGSQHAHRHLPDILGLIAAAGLPPGTAGTATRIFQRLAEAEAAVHGIEIQKVHFHEVGAADAIYDIVGAAAAIELLGIERIVCSPVPTGHGTVTCEHGVMPVPAPATANLLRGVPLAECEEPGELTTPTGAAILTTLAAEYGPPPAMRIEAIGYGAGTRAGRTRPNLLRVLIGAGAARGAAGDVETEVVAVLEAQLDDTTGQAVAYAAERLLEAGALDVHVVPIIMKKGRPGQLLAVLCRPDDAAALEAVMFAETPTLGVRRHTCMRSKLARAAAQVETRYGRIAVKVARRPDGTAQAWPEYASCVAAARAAGVPLRDVQQAALRVWQERTERGNQ